MTEKIKLIATEEHLRLPPYFVEMEAQKLDKTGAELDKIRCEAALELGKKHVAEMDAAGIDTQMMQAGLAELVRLTGEAQVKFVSEINKFVFELIKAYPGRFEGFASIPTSVPEAAAEEISRAVSEYGFKGVLVPANINGKYLDDPSFDPILKRAASLNVPIYIHPVPPSQELFNVLYAGNYPQEAAQRFSTSGWGWHIETGIHLLRTIYSGAFDRYPNLQIVVGHLGEAIPYMLPRIEKNMRKSVTKLNRDIGEYLRENVYYTFSGFNFVQSFLAMFLQVGVDRIMFSVDYPSGNMEEGAHFLKNLPICEADKRRIAYQNAEKLFNIR